MAKKALIRRSSVIGKQPVLNTEDNNKGIGIGELAINYEASNVALYTVKKDDESNLSVCNVMYESRPYKFLTPVAEHNNEIIIDEKKRWQVFKFSETPNPENLWEISMPSSSPMYWGKEIHSIIENNTDSLMTITIPSTYKSFDGYEFYILPDSMAEVSIVYDGTTYYVRAISDSITSIYTVQTEIDRGVYTVDEHSTDVPSPNVYHYSTINVQEGNN